MMMVFMGVFFLISNQPIMMMMVLIVITLLYSLYIYKIMGSYWFSYILIMVMLSGVMVVFMYIMSLIPNEGFEFYNLIVTIIFFMVFFYKSVMSFSLDMSYFSSMLWNSYLGGFNLFLISFLLSVMVLVVWISCMGEGSVRVDY